MLPFADLKGEIAHPVSTGDSRSHACLTVLRPTSLTRILLVNQKAVYDSMLIGGTSLIDWEPHIYEETRSSVSSRSCRYPGDNKCGCGALNRNRAHRGFPSSLRDSLSSIKFFRSANSSASRLPHRPRTQSCCIFTLSCHLKLPHRLLIKLLLLAIRDSVVLYGDRTRPGTWHVKETWEYLQTGLGG